MSPCVSIQNTGGLLALTSPDGKIYVAGYFTTAGGVSASRVAAWDGAVFTPLGAGAPLDVSCITHDKYGNVYFGVSGYGVYKWDGISLAVIAAGITANGMCCDSSGNLYVTGSFTAIGSVSAANVAMWNGSVWSALGSGVNAAGRSMCMDQSGNLYVTGDFTLAGGVANTRGIARWDGSAWSALGTGLAASGKGYGVAWSSYSSLGMINVTGLFTDAGGVANTANLARFGLDGLGWMSLGANSSLNGQGNSICRMANNDVIIAGAFTTVGGVTYNRIVRFIDYSYSFQALSTGLSGTAYGVATDTVNKVYVTGYFGTAGAVSAANVAMWDGSVWSALSSGLAGGTLGIGTAITANVAATSY